MPFVSRQVMLSLKQLAVHHCITSRLGQNWKFVRQNMSMKHNLSLIRCISMSSPLRDVKQLSNETACMDDLTSPAEVLANLAPEDEKRFKVLKLEYDVFISTGVRVPDFVSDEDWCYLLQKCFSPQSRINYYKYLFKREKANESKRLSRLANRLAYEEKMKARQQMKLEGTYEFLNAYRLRTLESTMNTWYNNNLYYAAMNGPHLVFDCSFENEMRDRELKNLARQVKVMC